MSEEFRISHENNISISAALHTSTAHREHKSLVHEQGNVMIDDPLTALRLDNVPREK
jgi:hypothetical protein